MSGKRSSRWYQFSLRALLLLVFVASVPLGGYVGYKSYLVRKRLAEIEGSFRWLESLGYTEMPNARAVRITIRTWNPQAGTTEPNVAVGFGFLLSEDSTSFRMVDT